MQGSLDGHAVLALLAGLELPAVVLGRNKTKSVKVGIAIAAGRSGGCWYGDSESHCVWQEAAAVTPKHKIETTDGFFFFAAAVEGPILNMA